MQTEAAADEGREEDDRSKNSGFPIFRKEHSVHFTA